MGEMESWVPTLSLARAKRFAVPRSTFGSDSADLRTWVSIFFVPRLLERLMSDRLLNGALWLLVMGMITATAGAGLILGYRGVFALCAGLFLKGGVTVGIGIFLAGGSYLLARHGNDLMDR